MVRFTAYVNEYLEYFGTNASWLMCDELGASALEYGLVVGLIALVIIAGLGLAGGTLSNLFNYIGAELSNVTPAA
jgi:pilus assembly protein Flp/PilA